MIATAQKGPSGPPLQASSHQASTSSNLDISASQPPGMVRSTSSTRTADSYNSRSDSTSDKATAALIRRVLCSHNVLLGNGEKGRTTPRPIEEVLPPLTSSNEVDLQLYGIISVIIKEFVYTWYSKITPDHVFTNEVIQIIAHCTRALEQRLRKVDLEALLLDEIPGLIEEHVNCVRLAKHQATRPDSLVPNPRIVYHALHPHPALSPVPTELEPSTILEQRESESAWRQLLVQGVLAVLLPTEDLQNGCLRALVAEIFAEMILGNGISGKACEGWLLWEGITRIAEVLQTDRTKEKDRSPQQLDSGQPLTRLERFGLLPSTDEPNPISKSRTAGKGRRQTASTSLSTLFWTAIQYTFLAFVAARAIFMHLVTSPSLPTRSVESEQTPVEGSVIPRMPRTSVTESKRPSDIKRPIVSMSLWSCAARLVELDVRMPWLLGFISTLHRGVLVGPGRVGQTDGVLDRFLSHTVRTRILDPAFLPIVLRTLRATLFPNNALGPPRQIPSNEEVKIIKHNCAATLLGLLPPTIARAFFATHQHEAQLQQLEDILDCLEDEYLNKHLIFQIVELIVLRLVPELGEQGVRDLLEERTG